MRSRPPTFHLREDQVALVANVDGGDSAEFPTIGDLLAHCTDTLGMDTDDEEGPYKPEAMAENILEAIGLDATAGIDTDSRAEIGDRLLTALEADTVADPDQVAGAVATALALEQPQGVRLIEALVEAAASTARAASVPASRCTRPASAPTASPRRWRPGTPTRWARSSRDGPGDAPSAPTVVIPAGVPPA